MSDEISVNMNVNLGKDKTVDDIVTRLRAEADRFRADAVDIPTAFENCADEIERLRAEVNAWMGVAERFAESDPRFDAYLNYFKLRFKGNDRG